MPLSSKLRAEYAELINQALDAVPITKPSDFRTVAENLEKILSNERGGVEPNFDPNFKVFMETILEYLNQPEMFVLLPSDYAEYQQIIKNRIQAKITEFNSFTPAQQHGYVRNQQQFRERASSHQETMAAGESRREANEATMEAESRAEHNGLMREQFSVEEQIRSGSGAIRGGAGFFRHRNDEEDRLAQQYPHRITVLADLGLVDRAVFATNVPNVYLTESALQNIREGRVRILSLQERGYLTSTHTGGVYIGATEGLLDIERATQRLDLLVARGFLSNEVRRNATIHELSMLMGDNIVKLIFDNKITVDEARQLTINEYINLNADGVYRLVHNNQLTVEEAKHLNTDQVIRLNAGEDAAIVLRGAGPTA